MNMNMRNSNPIIDKATFLHGIVFFIARATSLEKLINSLNNSGSRSIKSSTSFLGTQRVCPLVFGFISRKARNFSFSATLYEGISPEIIFENIEGIYLEIFNTLNFKVPFGTFISAISPIDFPNNPLPIGELIDILLEAKSASPSATII